MSPCALSLWEDPQNRANLPTEILWNLALPRLTKLLANRRQVERKQRVKVSHFLKIHDRNMSGKHFLGSTSRWSLYPINNETTWSKIIQPKRTHKKTAHNLYYSHSCSILSVLGMDQGRSPHSGSPSRLTPRRHHVHGMGHVHPTRLAAATLRAPGCGGRRGDPGVTKQQGLCCRTHSWKAGSEQSWTSCLVADVRISSGTQQELYRWVVSQNGHAQRGLTSSTQASTGIGIGSFFQDQAHNPWLRSLWQHCSVLLRSTTFKDHQVMVLHGVTTQTRTQGQIYVSCNQRSWHQQ